MTSDLAISKGIALIEEFEGLVLNAYPDPASGGAPWTIGWGLTRFPDGTPVKPGNTITKQQADAFLLDTVTRQVVPALEKVPHWSAMAPGQQAALISFAWNLGWGFYGTSGFETISARLRNKEWDKVPDALLLYRNPGSNVEAGLKRRREAEGVLWRAARLPAVQPLSLINVAKYYAGAPHQDNALNWLDQSLTPAQRTEFTNRWRSAPPLSPSPPANPLRVPYFSQRDNVSGQGYRECFSSTCAMLAAFYGKVKSDDEYNAVRARYGDTTDSAAQVKALSHLGLHASYTQQLTLPQLKAEVKAGRPVAVGWLHHGNYRSPSGGGHWSLVVGYQDSATIHHDPYGMCDIVRGDYKSSTGGSYIVYADQYWLPRWEVKGSDGWAVMAKP
jgi:GH24 family phage-related lysozyme (muramidase)